VHRSRLSSLVGRRRRGLTLPELIVILVVLSLGVALAVAWVSSRRETARRDFCQERLRRLALGVLQFEQQRRYLPGYVQRFATADSREPGATRSDHSWAVAVFPYIDQEPLWEQWRDGQRPQPYLPALVCPQDPVARQADHAAALSYVANCGRLPDPARGTGVFFDRRDPATAITLSLREIEARDGAERTLMLAENMQAGGWSDATIGAVGMGWWVKPPECSHINRCLGEPRGQQELRLARPSSFHPGGVNTIYCDGRGAFLAQTIDYRVLQGLMAYDDQAAGLLEGGGAAPPPEPPADSPSP